MNDQFMVKDSGVYKIEHLLKNSYCAECGKILKWERYSCKFMAECSCGTNWNTVIHSLQVFKEVS